MSEHTIDPNAGYEESDVNLFQIIATTIITVALIIGFLVGLSNFFIFTAEKTIDKMVLTPESMQLRDLRGREMEALNSYKLLDAEKGTYQIPIEKAMTIIAERAFEQRQIQGN